MEQPFEPGFIRPLPPLHSCQDEVGGANYTSKLIDYHATPPIGHMAQPNGRVIFYTMGCTHVHVRHRRLVGVVGEGRVHAIVVMVTFS